MGIETGCAGITGGGADTDICSVITRVRVPYTAKVIVVYHP